MFPKNISAKEMGVDHLKEGDEFYENAMKVAQMLQVIRDFYNPNNDPKGFKINVHVGYRDDAKNKSVGGAARSQHLVADAVDFSAYGFPLSKIYNDIMGGSIKLPHTISQLIIEESRINKGKWGWIHLARWTPEWKEARKSIGKNGEPNQFLKMRKDANGSDSYTSVNSPVPNL